MEGGWGTAGWGRATWGSAWWEPGVAESVDADTSVAPSVVIEKSVVNAASAADTYGRYLSYDGHISESVVCVDTAASSAWLQVGVTFQAAADYALGSQCVMNSVQQEAITATDELTSLGEYGTSVVEAITLLDSVAPSVVIDTSVSETVTADFYVAAAVAWGAGVTEAVTVVDTYQTWTGLLGSGVNVWGQISGSGTNIWNTIESPAVPNWLPLN